jgi:predicted molibdopterin-dependent oxidoreductase YjgC
MAIFHSLAQASAATVSVMIDDERVTVPAGITVAAALLMHGGANRTTPVSGSPRAPYCMMGACFDCLMEIDGAPSRQSCLVTVAEGMRIRRQRGARAAG